MATQGRGKRVRRTREHVIAELSFNYLERRVLLRGHALARVLPDYGIDAIMFTYSDSGEIENGDVRVQLKATDGLKLVEGGKAIALSLDLRHIRYWVNEPLPVVLVLYDAARDQAYWLDIQGYVGEYPDLLDPDAVSKTIRIPTSNRLSVRAIDEFRRLRDERIARYR